MGIYFLLLIHSSLMCHFYFYIFGDSSSILRFVPGPLILLFCLRIRSLLYGFVHCLLWFYPLFQGRFVCPAYRRFISIVLVWIRPLLPLKLGFMAAYSVLCVRIRPQLYGLVHFLFVVVLSTVSGQFRLPCLQEIRLHCFSVDSSTVAYKAWLYGCYQFMFCLFWHKKEAAASTVCRTGFPCHFFLR